MIFVAAGTQDGRELAGRLLSAGHEVTASVISQYGHQLLAQYPRIVVNDEPLDEEGLTAYLSSHGAELFVDASHPYAVNVSKNAIAAAHRVGIPYIRYERKSVPFDYDKVYLAESYVEAAQKASSFGKHIFLTTGSRNVKAFTTSPHLAEHEIIVRILPTADVVQECTDLGLTPKQIIAMQGPFSLELNKALFEAYHADVIVTKNSGEVGGTDTKLEAAKVLGLPVVMITRPTVEYDRMVHTFDEVLAFVEEVRKGEKKD